MPDNLSAARREILKAGFAVAASAILPHPAQAQAQAQTQAPLLTRPVPATGVRLPIVGIGTNRFRSGDPAYFARLRDTLAAFARLGGKVIDTAPAYGDSERVIGAILGQTGLREQLFLATKLDRDNVADGRQRLAESFAALATRRLDLVQLHSLRGAGTQFRAVGGRPLPAWAAEIDCGSWAQVFLKYVLSHPAVTCAIPGSTQVAHVEDNLGAARGRLPDAAQRQTIARYFDSIADS